MALLSNMSDEYDMLGALTETARRAMTTLFVMALNAQKGFGWHFGHGGDTKINVVCF